MYFLYCETQTFLQKWRFMSSSSSSSSGISRHPVDVMYRTERHVRSASRATNDCGSREGKTGAAAGAAIGAGVFAAIPPNGLWCPLGAGIGALIGWIVGEVCHNEHERRRE